MRCEIESYGNQYLVDFVSTFYNFKNELRIENKNTSDWIYRIAQRFLVSRFAQIIKNHKTASIVPERVHVFYGTRTIGQRKQTRVHEYL